MNAVFFFSLIGFRCPVYHIIMKSMFVFNKEPDLFHFENMKIQ
jgi:hypothetical protein